MELLGKNVVYVGGYGGIGYACCQELITQGIQSLVIIDLKDNGEKHKKLQCLNPKLQLSFIALNLCHGKEVIETVLRTTKKRMGHIDILINGAGIINDRKPKLTVETNLLGLIETTLAAIPLMSRAEGGKGGLIVNIASVLGLEPGAFFAVYSATKHGIIGFTRSCAADYYFKHTGIAHMAICPGATKTGLIDNFVGVDTFEFSKPLSEKYVTAKHQTAEECAKSLVAALAKAENGSVWIADLGKLQQVQMHQYWQYQFD